MARSWAMVGGRGNRELPMCECCVETLRKTTAVGEACTEQELCMEVSNLELIFQRHRIWLDQPISQVQILSCFKSELQCAIKTHCFLRRTKARNWGLYSHIQIWGLY